VQRLTGYAWLHFVPALFICSLRLHIKKELPAPVGARPHYYPVRAVQSKLKKEKPS
jgi:hypothetical protein